LKLRKKNIDKAIRSRKFPPPHYPRDTTVSSINSHCPIKLVLQGGKMEKKREREEEPQNTVKLA
jgi:hypothetical protein